MKTRFFIFTLFALFSFNLLAEKEVVFPKISKGNVEYWYVIKNLGIKAKKEKKWNYQKGFYANNQGNTDVVLSLDNNSGVIAPIHSWSVENISKWKILAGEKHGKYALVCSSQNEELYLQKDLSLSKNKYDKWQFEKNTGYGEKSVLIFQQEEEKSCIDCYKSNVRLSNLDIYSPFWTFIELHKPIKPTIANDTTWYALRNLNIDERKNKFLEVQKIKDKNFLLGKRIPKLLWAFVKQPNGYQLLNNKGQYLSFQTVFGDKITTVSEPEEAAVLNYSQVYTNENAGYKLYVGDKEKPKFVLHLKDASNFFSVMGTWLPWDMASCWDIVDEKDLGNELHKLFLKKYDECNTVWANITPILANDKQKFQSCLTQMSKYTKKNISLEKSAYALDKLENCIYEYRKGYDVRKYTSTKDNPKWYYLEIATIKVPYLKGLVMSNHKLYYGHAVLSKKSIENSRKWRFEKVKGQNLVKIINQSDGKMLKRNGTLAEDGDVFQLLPMVDGTFNITFPNFIPLAATTVGVGNFMGGVGSLAAWRILPVSSFKGEFNL